MSEIICRECGTPRDIEDGRIVEGDKRMHAHHFGTCSKCNKRTWSKPFNWRAYVCQCEKQLDILKGGTP